MKVEKKAIKINQNGIKFARPCDGHVDGVKTLILTSNTLDFVYLILHPIKISVT